MTTRLTVLGVAQDGGLPHVGCDCSRCAAARDGRRAVEKVACLGLSDGLRHFLFDATPDLPAQLHALGPGELSGIFLTHAHMGHYLGLAHLGREALDAQRVPLYVTPSMLAFLTANEPWNRLIDSGAVVPCSDPVVQLGDVSVRAIAVPHRGEFTDTVGYVISGPSKRVLFIPDIDAWAPWERDIAQEVAAVDVAYLDATFTSADELPGRDVSAIPHPLVTDSVQRLAGVAERVRFIHLNHSNPLWDDAAWIEQLGFHVAREGESFEL